MVRYRLGRALQFLAMVDCGVALMMGIANPAAYGRQLVVLASAVVLFGAGRLLQRRGEAALRAGGEGPPLRGGGGEGR